MTVTEIMDRDREGAWFRVRGFDGVAFWADKPETEPTENTYWDGIEEETGRVLMVMVGDDRRWSVDPDDVEEIGPGDFCHGCGQIGCRAEV